MEEKKPWEEMTHEEKNRELFFRQKRILDQFMEHGAISREQYEKSLGDLTEKIAL